MRSSYEVECNERHGWQPMQREIPTYIQAKGLVNYYLRNLPQEQARILLFNGKSRKVVYTSQSHCKQPRRGK